MMGNINLQEPFAKEHPMRSRRVLVRSLTLSLLVTTTLAGAAAVAAVAVAVDSPQKADAATAQAKQPTVSPEVGSYDVGLMLGNQLEHNGLVPVLSLETLLRGLKEGMGGRILTPEERDAGLRFMRDSHSTLYDKNAAAAHAFLEKNATQPGVVAMPSGLQYRVLAAGDPKGKSPLATDQVTVRYRTSLADGSVIDRSDSHDAPATFRVNTVFKAWQEAFSTMKTGAKWQLFVSPELGYGKNTPPSIPPGALLVYEIELLNVERAPPMDPATARKAPAERVKPSEPLNPQQ